MFFFILKSASAFVMKSQNVHYDWSFTVLRHASVAVATVSIEKRALSIMMRSLTLE